MLQRTPTPYKPAEQRNKSLRIQAVRSDKKLAGAAQVSAVKYCELEQLRKELLCLKNQNKQLVANNNLLLNKVDTLTLSLTEVERNLTEAKSTVITLKNKATNKDFLWKTIDNRTFYFLTGLYISDFSTLFALFVPFLVWFTVSMVSQLFCILSLLCYNLYFFIS